MTDYLGPGGSKQLCLPCANKVLLRQGQMHAFMLRNLGVCLSRSELAVKIAYTHFYALLLYLL